MIESSWTTKSRNTIESKDGNGLRGCVRLTSHELIWDDISSDHRINSLTRSTWLIWRKLMSSHSAYAEPFGSYTTIMASPSSHGKSIVSWQVHRSYDCSRGEWIGSTLKASKKLSLISWQYNILSVIDSCAVETVLGSMAERIRLSTH